MVENPDRSSWLSWPGGRTDPGRDVTAWEKRGPRIRSAEAMDHTVRAGDRTRTGDVQLGKLAFYQLNYARGSRNVAVV